MPNAGFIKLFFSTLLLLLVLMVTNVAQASVITIEPDDYAVGTDLSNVSPYVTLQSRGEFSDYPVFASSGGALGDPDYFAPTGNLTFGHYPFIIYSSTPEYVYGGLALTFHQEVSHLTFLANSDYYLGLPATWFAFDRTGNEIANGRAGLGVPFRENFLIDIRVDNMWSIVVGGEAGIAAVNFDHLTFDINDPATSVPEPTSLILLLSGLLMMVLPKKLGTQNRKDIGAPDAVI